MDKLTGKEKRAARLEKNVPRTLDNTRIYNSSSYLTADPRTLQPLSAPQPANAPQPDHASSVSEDNEDEDEDEEMPEAGPSTARRAPNVPEGVEGNEGDGDEEADEESAAAPPQPVQPTAPPRILITTSASPCKETYAFCDDLKNIFPGGELFKRPKGRGFELGRISRWAAKRRYNAMLVVNEDHKTASRSTKRSKIHC